MHLAKAPGRRACPPNPPDREAPYQGGPPSACRASGDGASPVSQPAALPPRTPRGGCRAAACARHCRGWAAPTQPSPSRQLTLPGCSARRPSGPADTMASSVTSSTLPDHSVQSACRCCHSRPGWGWQPRRHEAAACPSRSRTSDADRIAAPRSAVPPPGKPARPYVLCEFLGAAACLGTVRNWRAMLTLSGRDLHDAAHSPGQDQGSCAPAPGSDALAADLGLVSLSVRWSHERVASTRSYRMYSCSSLPAGP